MVIGDKSKAQLSRALPSNLKLTFNQIGRDIPTFADAAGVADLITQSGVKYDSVVIVYNKFLNNIAYEAATVEVKGEEALKESSAFDFILFFNKSCVWVLTLSLSPDSFKVYENEDDATKDLAEFSLANAIYAALVEGHACEQSARYGRSNSLFSSLLKPVFYSARPPWTMLPRTPRTWLAHFRWSTTVVVKPPSQTNW